MPRHNRGISLPINEDGDGNKSFFPKLGFFTVVGGVMAALSLNERWDNYRSVPSSSTGNGFADPAVYRDDSDAESAIGLVGGLDTEIPATRRKRSRKNCCMCCGMNCGLFCKALGIAVLIFVLWNGFKFAKWMLTPSPTGLEDMPEYSKSLGCEDGSDFYYQNNQDLYYSVPIDSRKGVYSMDLSGGAVGTIFIIPSAEDETQVKVKTSLRTNERSLFDSVLIEVSNDAEADGYYKLSAPIMDYQKPKQCMRYDLTLYIPPNLADLTIKARSTTQIKYSDAFMTVALRMMNSLTIEMSSFDTDNLLIFENGLMAIKSSISVQNGYIVGVLPIIETASIDTRRGSAVTKIITSKIQTLSDRTSNTTTLKTDSGSGRTDITFLNAYHETINNEHIVHGNGDMYLTYKKAVFNGRIDMQAKSYTATGVQGMMAGHLGAPVEELPWVGNKDGGDLLKIKSDGWVGLYF